MTLRITNLLLFGLLVMIGLAAYLQTQANNRHQLLLEDIHAELAQLRMENNADRPSPTATRTARVTPLQRDVVVTSHNATSDAMDPASSGDEAAAGHSRTPAQVAVPSTPRVDLTHSPTVADAAEAIEGPSRTDSAEPDSGASSNDGSITESGDDPLWQTLEPQYISLIRSLLDGEYQPVLARLTPTYASQLTPELLKQTMDPIRAEHGSYDTMLGHRRITEGLLPNHTCYQVRVKTKRDSRWTFTIALDEVGRIASLHLKPAE